VVLRKTNPRSTTPSRNFWLHHLLPSQSPGMKIGKKMASNQSKILPELDEKHFGRNQKTAWLLYLNKLTAWLWQDNEGAARWTLILDDVLRRASINHPPRTAAGLKNQVQGSAEGKRGVRSRSERQPVPAAHEALCQRPRRVAETQQGRAG